MQGRFGQAFLFVGPDGVGKRLFALELAKALLCERPPASLTACDRCPSCAQVEAGTHPDVFVARREEDDNELKIDVMRHFCEQLAMKSTRGHRKIGIVEDVDAINQSAANSFLKTLEEPPLGAVLLLLATSLEQQLPTVLSRCQIVRFAPLRPDDMRFILIQHGVEEARIEPLISPSAGSVSQALALNVDDFGAVRRRLIEGLTSPRPDFVALAETWNRFNEEAGKDMAAQRLRMSLMIRFLLEALRQALRLSVGATVAGLESNEAERLRSFAERLGPERLDGLIDRCIEADAHVKRYVQLTLVVESVLDPFVR